MGRVGELSAELEDQLEARCPGCGQNDCVCDLNEEQEAYDAQFAECIAPDEDCEGEYMKTYLAIYDVDGDVCTVQVDLSEEQYQDLLDHASVYKLIPLSLMHLLPKAGYSFLKDLPEDV